MALLVVILVALLLAGAGALGLRRARSGKWASAGGVVVDRRGRIAVVRQRDRKHRWRWTLPKGRIDHGETAELAALREVYEEGGLRARIVRPLLLHEGRRHFTYYFEMALVADDGVHDDETRKVRFVSVVEATDRLRSRRDLEVLRRLVELRTRVVAGEVRAQVS